MNLRELVTATEAYIRGEIEAQHQLSATLDAQAAAVAKSDTEGLIASCEGLEKQFAEGVTRERERRRLLAGFGRIWSIDPSILSLTSIAERLGPHGKTLSELRSELRETVGGVMRQARKMSALAQYQQGIFEEILHAVAGAPVGVTGEPRGVLLDAEA